MREISPFLGPISLADLIEAVMVATRDHREISKRLRERLPSLNRAALAKNAFRKSTVRVNHQVLSYLTKVVDPGEQRAVALFLHWIASDWQTLRGYFHIYATTLDEVIGCTGYVGKPYGVTDMDKAITAETKPRHARS